MEIQEMWERDTTLNTNIHYLFNREIYEYDMKEAGFSLIQEYGLLPSKVINSMKQSTKDARKIKIGVMERTNKELVEKKKEAFVEARKNFITSNDLSVNDIISVKKDAIFTCKRCNETNFGKYIEFRPKNQYTSYIHIAGIEIYFNDDNVDIKGISDAKLEMHEEYMVSFIKDYCKKMESDSPEKVIAFTRRFIDKYKARELETGYYLPLNKRSTLEFLNIEGERVLDIKWNLTNILIPLIKIPL